MITIEYTLEPFGSEPGPIVIWLGECQEYMRFLNDVHALGSPEFCEILLEKFDYISLIGISSYRLRSLADGNALCRKDCDAIEMELDPKLWRDILRNILSITFRPSFIYQEFDGVDLIENAKIIMRSNLNTYQ